MEGFNWGHVHFSLCPSDLLFWLESGVLISKLIFGNFLLTGAKGCHYI